jgi:hypothetical protein
MLLWVSDGKSTVLGKLMGSTYDCWNLFVLSEKSNCFGYQILLLLVCVDRFLLYVEHTLERRWCAVMPRLEKHEKRTVENVRCVA